MLLAPAAPATALSWYAQTDNWAYSEPLPVLDYADRWKRPLGAGSDGHALLQAETGVRIDAWTVAWVWQRQYVIDASRDAAALYHADRNDRPLAPNRVYAADVAANFYEANGLRIGHRFELQNPRLTVSPSLVLWRGTELEDGRLRGTALTDSQGELQYAASLAHSYSEDHLLDRSVQRPDGWGASLDLQAQWALGAADSLRLDARNLLGRLWWSSAPFTEGRLSSDTRQTDAQGNVRFAPTLTGFEGNATHRQRLPLFAIVEWTHMLDHSRVHVGLTHTDIGSFPLLGLGRSFGSLSGELRWWPSAGQALTAELAWKGLTLGLGSNALRPQDAEQLQLRIALEVPLTR